MFYIINIRHYKKKFILITSFIVLLVTFFLAINFIFPLEHFDLIKKYSQKYNLDPALICSIIHTESKFKVNAVSYKGASGLMQIRKTTADWAAEEIKISDYQYEKIFEPEINIQIGCWYINNLIKQFNNIDCAICAYNAGSGNVAKWLKNNNYSLDGKTLYRIPFSETKNYLKRVKKNQTVYHFLINLINFIKGG